MRAKAYPGEDPATVKEPAVVADAILNMLETEFESGHRLVLEG
jgi:CBS domain-containing protein